MLSKCANTTCSNTFHYFHEGKLYLIERKAQPSHSREPEYFWLCSSCCREMTIQMDDSYAITVLRKQGTTPGPGTNHLLI